MTPLLDDHTPSDYQPDLNVCPSCVLFAARGGRRCPPAQEAYDLRELTTIQNLEVLRMAVQADARAAQPSFAELVRQDAVAGGSRNPTLALPPGAPTSNVNDSKRKEAECVPARTVR
jgi:hypothetical protein